MTLKAIWQKLLSKDLYTWLGHGVMGFLLTLIAGPAFTAGAFVYREASDLIEWKFADPPKRKARDKIKDGFFDLWAPLLGAALAVGVRSLF